MQTITSITSEIGKKTKLSQEQIKKVLTTFLELAKQKLNQGESISFKNYFTLKRGTTQPKGDKNCSEHQQALNKHKQANKGKGISAYAGSVAFRNLITKTKECKGCKVKKQALAKSVKLTNRVNFKVSEGFWSKTKKSS